MFFLTPINHTSLINKQMPHTRNIDVPKLVNRKARKYTHC